MQPDNRAVQIIRVGAMIVTGCLIVPAASSQPATQAGESNALPADINAYEEAIAELDGSYDQNSSELFLSLAQAQRQAGNLEEAKYAYREALQALRINEGLATESQLAVLEEYNGLLFQYQEWKQLDTNMHLAEDISRRLYSMDDDRYVSAALALANWKIRAYRAQVYRPDDDRSVQEAAEIYRILLNRLPDDSGDYGRRITYLWAQGLAHFYSAQHAAGLPVEEFRHAASQMMSYQQCIPIILSVDSSAQPSAAACNANQISDPEYFAAQQREKNNTVRRYLGNMRQSFLEASRAVEANPDASLRDRAVATLNLGDANLLAEDYQRARTQYRRAWEMLSRDGESVALREELMGRAAKALVGILDEIPGDPRIRGEGGPLGTVSFDVTETGEIININIEGSPVALEQDNIAAIALRLDQSVYRPKIVDGRPVASRVTVTAADL